MAFYVDKIEQVKGTEETPINEYGGRTKFGTYEAALTKFYTDLGNVSNDLIEVDPANKHYFMDIRIVDGLGGVVKRDSVGKHQDI